MEVKRLVPSELSEHDFERALDTTVEAFAGMDVMHVSTFERNMQVARAWWSKRLKGGLACGEVYQIDDYNGIAIWTPPGVEMDSPKGPGVKAMGGSPPEDVLRTILGEKALERRRNFMQTYKKHLKDSGLNYDDAWYLNVLAVSPQRQGNGLGRALMEHKLQDIKKTFTSKPATDAPSIPKPHRAYLGTVGSSNERFYKSRGFKTSTVIPLTDPDELVDGRPRIYYEAIMDWDCASE